MCPAACVEIREQLAGVGPPFHCGGCGDPTWAVSLGDKYLVSHLAGPSS